MDKFEYSREAAEAYAHLGIEGTSYQMAFEELERMVGDVRNAAVLDFGCGTGRSTRFMHALGARQVIGVDHNYTMINKARDIPPKVSNMQYVHTCNHLPFPDNAFDVGISLSALIEQKDLDAMRKAVAEIHRTVKERAMFVLGTANPASFGHDYVSYSRVQCPYFLRSGDPTPCTIKGEQPFTIEDVYWRQEDYERVLRDVGFQIEDVRFPKAEEGDGWLDETEVAPEMLIQSRKISEG